MAKISSADCITFAMAHVPEVADCPRKNWKRREKFKVGEETIRVFETWKPQIEMFRITVVERGGVIVKATSQVYQSEGSPDSAKVPPRVFIFATSDMSSEYFQDWLDMDPHYQVVTIGTVKVWKEEGCCTDDYSERERTLLEPVCQELGLEEAMEATYSTKKFATQAELVIALETAGIKHDLEFQKFMDSCGE